MPVRFLMWFSWFWLGGTFLSGIALLDQNSQLDPAENPTINDTLLIGQINIQQINLHFVQIPIPIPDFSIFSAFGTILTWNYPYFTGGWEFLRFFILMPITFVTIWMLLTVVGPIFLQTIAVIRNLLRL